MAAVVPISSMSDPPGRRETVLERVNRAVNGRIERAFDSLGRIIARRPWVTIALAVFWALALGSGVRTLENETRHAPPDAACSPRHCQLSCARSQGRG